MCPYAYKGNKCETHEFLNDDHGKLKWMILFALFSFYLFIIIFFCHLLLNSRIECNLSKDTKTTDDSEDYTICSGKCLNDLSNRELCSCHQNNEIGKKKSSELSTLSGFWEGAWTNFLYFAWRCESFLSFSEIWRIKEFWNFFCISLKLKWKFRSGFCFEFMLMNSPKRYLKHPQGT